MKINELAHQAGVTSKTIRYYENIGLLPAASRSENGYRRYRDVDVGTLVFIRRCRELQIPLEPLKMLVKLRTDKTAPCAEIDTIIKQQRDKIHDTIIELKKLEESLNELAQCCRQETVSECEIVQKLSDRGSDRSASK